MQTVQQSITELARAAAQILGHVRKMSARGDTRDSVESYLGDCRESMLRAADDVARRLASDLFEDMVRAIRYASADGEMVGALAVLTTVPSNQDSGFRCLSLTAQQRIRAEVRDRTLLRVCSPDDIKVGAELALSSLEPLVAA